MKNLLGSLIISGTVGVVVTSALVVARRRAPGRLPARPPQENLTTRRSRRTGRTKVKVPTKEGVKTRVILNAQAMARPAQPRKPGSANMRQARPLVRAELIFVRKICELDVEHFRRINQDVEAEFKEVAKKLVEAQQQGRVRVVGRVQTPADR